MKHYNIFKEDNFSNSNPINTEKSSSFKDSIENKLNYLKIKHSKLSKQNINNEDNTFNKNEITETKLKLFMNPKFQDLINLV